MPKIPQSDFTVNKLLDPIDHQRDYGRHRLETLRKVTEPLNSFSAKLLGNWLIPTFTLILAVIVVLFVLAYRESHRLQRLALTLNAPSEQESPPAETIGLYPKILDRLARRVERKRGASKTFSLKFTFSFPIKIAPSHQ